MDCKKEETLRRGPWLEEEDKQLVKFVTLFGQRRWDSLAKVSCLKRSGKSCRLRWMNYLNPCLKHGPMSQEEEMVVLQLHALWGNKWSKIARRLPGRTDNEIKNYWRTHLRKKGEDQNYAGSISTRRTQEHGFDEIVKEFSQSSMGSDEENNGGGICQGEGFGLMNSPYENRISDWISEISEDQNEANILENSNNIGSWWFQEIRNFEEFSCTLWS